MGRKAHEPTDTNKQLVKALSAYGAKHTDICARIGVNQDTLRKYYREELDFGAVEANAKVAETLYQLASGKAMERGATWSDVSRAAMFWAKTRMGWQERHDVYHQGQVDVVHAIERQLVRPKD